MTTPSRGGGKAAEGSSAFGLRRDENKEHKRGRRELNDSYLADRLGWKEKGK